MKRDDHSSPAWSIRRGMVRFVREEDGPTASEYAFMIAAMVLASVVGITAFSDSAIVIMDEITTTLTTSVADNL